MSQARRKLSWSKGTCIGFGHDPSHLPSRRSGHSVTTVGINGYLFGGLDGSVAPPEASEDMFVVRISPEDCEWKRLAFPGSAPGVDRPIARWRHTATQINPTTILLFGGCHSHDERLNDCWLFDTITNTWERRGGGSGSDGGGNPQAGGGGGGSGSGSGQRQPSRPPRPPRSAAARTREIAAASAASASSSRLRAAPPQVYTLPVQEPRSEVFAPSPRAGHTACLVGTQYMWLFGGGCE